MGRTIQLFTWPPQRIISVVPSQTELLFALGLDMEVVGITKFCVHPDKWCRNKKRIGGTKKLHIEAIKALKPDLIIGNKEENSREDIETLAAIFPVWMSDITNLDDALQMISMLGIVTNTEVKANKLADSIAQSFEQLTPKTTPIQAAYLIWREPYMAAASSTFINDMLNRIGLKNVFADKSRYPEITPTQLQQANPDCILLSSEPYPFKDTHIAELQAICPTAKIILVDGELFSWYGPRLLHSAAYFAQLLTML